jgi:hypothetical protein
MSPKVGELGSILVTIKPAEHGNPHVHAYYPGRSGDHVKIFIRTLGIETGGLPSKQMKRLEKWIIENEEYLLDRWEEITDLPSGR